MEMFPDGVLVRLRSHDHGGYLHADEDGRGVSLSLDPKPLDMAWMVQRILHDGSTRMLLRSAAHHGRFLAALSESDQAAPGLRVFLGEVDTDYDLIIWKAVESGSSGYVLLRHVSSLLLRATGLENGACIDVAHNQNAMMHWKVETTPTSPTARPAAAMEQFTYGALVRLQSREHGGYLHSDEDGMAVSLCWHRESMNAAWKVLRMLHNGSTSILLQNAAHGRYLAASSDPAPPGRLGRRVVVGDCDRNVDRILWEPVGSGDAGYVLLRHVFNRRLLRSNGIYRDVSIDVAGNQPSMMMQWKVVTITGLAPASPPEAVMEQFFADGAYVRLRRVDGWYLHADEDGMHASFIQHRGSLNTVWLVHRILNDGTSCVLLQNAAYGRYLGASASPQQNGILLQSIYYSNLQQHDLRWECMILHEGSTYFSLVNRMSGLTIPLDGTALVVEFIPLRRGLPPDLPAGAPTEGTERQIIYIQGDEYGNIDFTGAGSMLFQGRSVFRLRAELAYRVDVRFPVRIAMFLWAGIHGRLIPLISNLPDNNQTIEVIVFDTWTRVALGLQYPHVEDD